MITKAEIEAKAVEFEIHPSNVERDYVFGWFLFGVFTMSALKDEVFLKGGNALRKAYFASTRFSGDLDFGIAGDIDPTLLREELNRVCAFVRERSGIEFLTDDTRIDEKFTAAESPLPDLRVFEIRVYFKDFYGNPDSIRLRLSMDLTRFDRVLLDIQRRQLIHPYSDANAVGCEIRCMQLEEIIATKLKCLMQRQHAPDLFDYVYTIRQLGGDLNKAEVVRVLVQKTIFGRNPSVLKGILGGTGFDFFRDSWGTGIICARQVLFSAEEAIADFLADLEVLFAPFNDSGVHDFAYFGAGARMPILLAGRTLTRMKMRYNGQDRIIEPYSLKYLIRRDGIAREYFYAYNVSGGSNPPGIRCFVASGVEHIENTDDVFEPRFLVELSKAGETPNDPYLFDPNRPMRAPRSRSGYISSAARRRAPGSPKYVYQCGYCGRKFSKTHNTSSIGPHKAKGGSWPCSGRSGVYVGTKY